jgi:thioredoxin 1
MNQITDQNFNDQISKAQLPVIVDFWAPWCGPCKMVAPVFEQLSQKFNDKMIFCKMNVDENPQTSGSYNVSGIPTFIIFNAGKEAGRMVGFGDSAKLQSFIEPYLK